MRDQANSSAAITASESFQPFGEPEAKTGAPSALGYTGALAGPEGMVYDQARYYDPATAQFMTPDSVIPNGPGTQGYGLYGYAANDPVSRVDPTGHMGELLEPLEGRRHGKPDRVFGGADCLAGVCDGDQGKRLGW